MQLGNTTLFSDASLIAYYRLDTGALTTDSKGSNTLTNNNTVAETTVNQRYGSAAADYGTANTNKFLDIATGLGIDLSLAYSVSMWVRGRTEPASGNTDFFLGHFSTTGTSRYFSLDYNNNSGTFRLQVDPSGGSVINYNTTLGITGYHHIVITAAAGGNVTLYFDGVSVATTTRGSTTSSAVNHTWIGSNQGGSNFPNIYLDDVGFFNKELTVAEVLLLFNDGGGLDLTSKMW